jgi:hypothetical protein
VKRRLQRGYCVTQPMTRILRRNVPVVQPLFAGLLFVRDDGLGVPSPCGERGAYRVVFSRGEPLRIRRDVLDDIAARSIDGYVSLRDELPVLFRPRSSGWLIEVYDMLFRRMHPEGRAALFVELMTRTDGALPPYKLESVA